MPSNELDPQQADLERLIKLIAELQRPVPIHRQEGLQEIAEIIGQSLKEGKGEGSQ